MAVQYHGGLFTSRLSTSGNKCAADVQSHSATLPSPIEYILTCHMLTLVYTRGLAIVDHICDPALHGMGQQQCIKLQKSWVTW
jgi:hypothetical protein